MRLMSSSQNKLRPERSLSFTGTVWTDHIEIIGSIYMPTKEGRDFLFLVNFWGLFSYHIKMGQVKEAIPWPTEVIHYQEASDFLKLKKIVYLISYFQWPHFELTDKY